MNASLLADLFYAVILASALIRSYTSSLSTKSFLYRKTRAMTLTSRWGNHRYCQRWLGSFGQISGRDRWTSLLS